MVNEGSDLNKLEEKRRDALARQDAVTYSRLCNKLGVSPEDVEDEVLYQLGNDGREYHRQVGIGIAKRIAKERALEEVAQELHATFKHGGTPYENTRWMRECYEGVKTIKVNGEETPVPKVDDAVLANYSIKLMSEHPLKPSE